MISRLLKKAGRLLWRFEHRNAPESGLRRELYFLNLGITENEMKLQEMKNSWPQGACCPSCYFGRPYIDLCDKLERQRKRRETLLRRLPTCQPL